MYDEAGQYLDEEYLCEESSLSERIVDAYSNEISDMALQHENLAESEFENTANICTSNKAKKKNGSVPKNVSKSEKRFLARLVQQEVVIWDLKHEHHSNVHALQAAWDRISKKMPGTRSSSDCKAIWKSLRDSLRYRRKRKMGKTGTSGDEAETAESFDVTDVWEFDDCMAFLIPMSTKYPRKTTVMGMENITSNGETTNQTTSDDLLSETASVTTEDVSSQSNYSYADGKKKKDALSESVITMTKSVSDYVAQKISCRTNQPPAKQLNFEHLWLYLDNLFGKMTPEQRDVLNLQYVSMAIDMLKKQ